MAFLRKKLENANEQLARCPEGTLQKVTTDREPVYFLYRTQKGRRKRAVITHDSAMLRTLARKEWLRVETDILKNNIGLLNQIEKRYVAPTESNIRARLKKAYRDLPYDYFLNQQSGDGDRVNRPYRQSDYKPEHKVYPTSAGFRVRSKSELIIAEYLYVEKVDFRYEELLFIGNRTFAPDFTIRKRNGELMYWEHCGLTANSRYMAAHRDKMRIYESAGIVPWHNLIVTYDDQNGILNTNIVKSEIKNKILD